MRIHDGETGAITEVAAVSFQIRYTSINELLTVHGTPDGATVQLLVRNDDTGVFGAVLDPYGTPIGLFVDKTGSMLIQFGQAIFGKVIISGGGGSQDLTVDYGAPA